MKKQLKSNTKFKITLGFLVILSITLSICARFTTQFPGDLYLTLHLQSISNHFILSILQGVSFISKSLYLALMFVIIGVIIWWRIGRRESMLVLLAALLSLLVVALKLVIGRPRPSANLVHVLSLEQDYGFPSGHAIYAIVILGLFAYFCYTNINNRILRILVPILLIVFILLIGISRVYLGVHWPSDVVGGYLIGGMILTGLIWFYQTWKARQTDGKDK
jgi:undecaprenyl-diphosphatase